MRKKLLLLLAALAVAIIPGREASAVSVSPTNSEKEAFALSWKTGASDELAFVLPWKTVTSDEPAFVMPWKTVTSDELAFVMPWKTVTSDELAFVLPWKTICDTGVGVDFERFAMLPLGAETGRHIRNGDDRNSDAGARMDQAPKPVANVIHDNVADYLGNSFAMLPLGTETGRHIRNLGEDNKQPERTVATNSPKASA